MSLDNAKEISLDGFRVIGLKDSDKEKLIKAQESSFEVPEAVVEPVPEETPVVTPEVTPVAESSNTSEQVPPVISNEANIFDQQPTATVEQSTPVTPEVPVEPTIDNASSNIFDQPAPEVTSEPVVEKQEEANVLDTPQTFFNREETPEASTSVMEEDPLLIIIDNARKLVEDKNAMIKALNDKILVLEEQLRVSEEGRKVSEDRRVAAETTLSNARIAESNSGGPSLVYQNPTNGNMAA